MTSNLLKPAVQPLMQLHLAEPEPLIEKPNVLRETGGMTMRCFYDVAKELPGHPRHSYTNEISPADTFVHLIGVPHPSPAKAAQFRDVDLVSIRVAVNAAREAGIRHFIYLSVAQPAPVMKTFLEVRHAGEEMIRASGMTATFIRPWYVLGPGHRWPYPLLPFFWLLEQLPPTRETARRLGFVTIDQMVGTLVWAVENPPDAIRIIDVPKIRELGRYPEVRLLA